ncbi:hypothetical protein [Halpernia sp. GG3]
MKARFIFLFCTLLQFSFAQDLGFKINAGKKTVIPFQLINNLIFIPVTVNGISLTFLLDSGVSETILFSLENKEVNFENVEKVKFSGLGDNVELFGLKTINNDVKINNHFEDPSHTIFLILNEDFKFSSHVGIPVNGIIGYHFFKNNPVQIDYIRKKITVYNEDRYFTKKENSPNLT